MIRVYICDDIEEICVFFKNIIDADSDMEVVGTGSSGKKAVADAARLMPDVVLMDIQMETKDAGIIAAEKITEICPKAKIIMLTVHEDEEFIARSYIAGAVDYLMKLSEPEFIVDEIKKVYSGEIQIGAIIANNIKNEFKKTKTLQNSLLFVITKWSSLTNSEIEIIRLVAEGYSRKEIMQIKHVEMSTVKSQINSIMRKMGYSNTKALINDLEHLGIMPYIFTDKK